jgi:hypothetical protein
MDNALAHEGLAGVLKVIDRWGFLYEHRCGYRDPNALKNPALEREVNEGIDEVRKRTSRVRVLFGQPDRPTSTRPQVLQIRIGGARSGF